MAVNPCEFGECDPVSQCTYKMREQGVETYGSGAFGPGGSLVDTNLWFHVQTDFVSHNNYANLWKVRTTIKQGENTPIVME